MARSISAIDSDLILRFPDLIEQPIIIENEIKHEIKHEIKNEIKNEKNNEVKKENEIVNLDLNLNLNVNQNININRKETKEKQKLNLKSVDNKFGICKRIIPVSSATGAGIQRLWTDILECAKLSTYSLSDLNNNSNNNGNNNGSSNSNDSENYMSGSGSGTGGGSGVDFEIMSSNSHAVREHRNADVVRRSDLVRQLMDIKKSKIKAAQKSNIKN